VLAVSALSREGPPVNEDRTSLAVALAKALASRIAEVVPEEFHISVDQTAISIRFRDTEESIDIERIVDQAGDSTGNIEAAAFMVLSDVQDLLTESTQTPWPPVVDSKAEVLPYPHAKVANGELQLFFGATENPALALRPIMLAGLRDE
jgi:hypothetical protein